ncbi:hypothetical protein [Bordetella genomosp. 6]|uniref:Phage tail protein n=1 Tax=Bordetella genomosp. 6 TaxID=463024 RepID=A0ABX4FD64_9BORD|nr:hypothetical protein [Bordetella genomosp. 6]OZI78744.1 hypothetical protein CAL23_13050 [Bordetella genomosp. 6]
MSDFFYSATDNAFYPEALRGAYEDAGTWPADTMPVDAAVYQEFVHSAPPVGKVRAAGADGMPTWADEVPIVQVPVAVTAAQGGIALIHFGLMDGVMTVVNSPDTPATHKWAFERSTTWERNSPSFNYLADAAGISEQQKDDLFVFASAVNP